MKILISGASGFIGSALVSVLSANGNLVYKLVRSSDQLTNNTILCNYEHNVLNIADLESFDVVIHLAGENIICRWTATQKARIRKSRVEGTQFLSSSIAKLLHRPTLFICASAIGYYGNRGNEILNEQSGNGTGFLAEICREWEAATQIAVDRGIRTINLRLGVVLDIKGGMLQRMLTPFKYGLGGDLGSGSQYISWIMLEDLIRIVQFIMINHEISGAVNAVAPNSITNHVFTKILGEILHRPTFLTIPPWAIYLIFGTQMGKELLLSSTRAYPQQLENKQFQFLYPHLEEGLRHIIAQ